MTVRDRTVLIVVGVLAICAAFWFLAISPKRKDATALTAQVATAQARLDTATASAASATGAKARYTKDYSTVARLGKAVPVDDDVPSLVYQLQHLAKANDVTFNSVKMTGAGGGASAAPTGAAAAVASATGNTNATASSTTPAVTAAALPPGATVGAAGFPVMPFAFDFTGSFFNMQRFLHALNSQISVNSVTGGINVTGRLLTTDGVSFKAAGSGFPMVDVSVVATSYLLPADEGLTAGATATTPDAGAAGATTSAGTSGSTATASMLGTGN